MIKYKWLGKDLQKEKVHVHGIRSCHTSWDHCWPLESTHITWNNFYCLFQNLKFMIHHSNLSFLRYCFISSSCLRASPPPQLPVLSIFAEGEPFLIVHMDTDLCHAWNCAALAAFLQHNLHLTEMPSATTALPSGMTVVVQSSLIPHWLWKLWGEMTLVLAALSVFLYYVPSIPLLKSSVPDHIQISPCNLRTLSFYILCDSITLRITL